MLVETCVPLKFSYLGGNFYCLLITFANSLDTDQAQQNVGPHGLDSNYLTLCHGIPEALILKTCQMSGIMQRVNKG